MGEAVDRSSRLVGCRKRNGTESYLERPEGIALFAEAEAPLKNPAVRVYNALQDDAADRARRPRTDDEDRPGSSRP